MGRPTIHPPDGRFSCQSCGRCCTLWSVTVDEAKVAKLRETDWSAIGAGDPFERNRGPGDAFRIRMVGGRCFFLDENQHCRIHGKLGYDAKPEGCKAFPLHFLSLGEQNYARLSFYCPSVCSDSGKPLKAQQRWLRSTQQAAGDVQRSAPFTLEGSTPLSDQQVDQCGTLFERLIEDQRYPMSWRIAAGSGFLRALDEAAAEQEERGIRKLLDEAAGRSLPQLARIGTAEGRPSMAGPVLSLFLGADCAPSKLARFGHFWNVRLFNLGLAPLSSAIVGARASRGAIAKVSCDQAGADDALLRRYFLHKLRGRRHLAGELSLIAGYNLLVASYGIINLLARLSAAATGRQRCDPHDIAAAVQAADLFVVEHTTLRHGAMFGQLVDRILSQPGLCAALWARLGIRVEQAGD